MKRINRLISLLIITMSVSLLSGCTADEDVLRGETDTQEVHTCRLVLNASKGQFSDQQSSRSAAGWENGDKVYLTFEGVSSMVYGTAEYSQGAWTISYYGTLSSTGKHKCCAVYIEDEDYVAGTVVNLTENSCIFEDANAEYMMENGDLIVAANLKPKTGRIRFTGSGNENVIVYGLTHYTTYDLATGSFSTSTTAVTEKVEGGTTPYLYGEFADNNNRRLVLLTSESGFTRTLSSTIFRPGESGYMAVPDVKSHSGWQNAAIFNVKGVDFTMLPVEKESGNYLMAQTETTERLYRAVVSKLSSSDTNQPQIGTHGQYPDFISKLNDLTNLQFAIPTFEEWYYAATGGNRSKGFTFSGSNVIGEVGWYQGNSNYRLSEVMQLKPNELGLYDMTGNASEFVAEGTWVGGSYHDNESTCKLVNNSLNTGSSYYAGFRFILKLGK